MAQETKTETFTGGALELMISEGLSDVDADDLAEIAALVTGCPVRVISDDQFEIDWPKGG